MSSLYSSISVPKISKKMEIAEFLDKLLDYVHHHIEKNYVNH